MSSVRKGESVEWKNGGAKAEGTVTAVHTDDVTKTIKGKTIKRKASAKEPAVEVKTKKGATALHSASEVKAKKA